MSISRFYSPFFDFDQFIDEAVRPPRARGAPIPYEEQQGPRTLKPR